MPSAQISLRGDTPTGGLDVCLAVWLADWQLAGWVSNYLIFPTRPPHPIIVAVRACHTEYGTHLGRPHTTSEMVLRAGVCLVPPCRHLILRAARKTSSITGSTRNPSFLGKIKVMTAERTNMRTVPAARCMSRIGDGGDGSWTVQLGGPHVRPRLWRPSHGPTPTSAAATEAASATFPSALASGSTLEKEILKGETSLQAPTSRHKAQSPGQGIL